MTMMTTPHEVIPPPMSHDPVNHPAHYTSHPSGIECIQITEHMNFNLGNAVKYIWRCFGKGQTIQDLSKAIFYLEREKYRLAGLQKKVNVEEVDD